MYKLLLCWRYLRTRWIALASIISVMLGVATMIVVNSVMEGFSSEMEDRMHGILSDLVLRSWSFDGMSNVEALQEQIRQEVGDQIVGMSPIVYAPAVMTFPYGTAPVDLVGIDEKTIGSVNDIGKYLQHRDNRQAMSFQLREGGYDGADHQAGPEARKRPQMAVSGWGHRREEATNKRLQQEILKTEESKGQAATPSAKDSPSKLENPFAQYTPKENVFDPGTQQHTGAVLGIAMVSFPKGNEDQFLAVPGDDVTITFPTVGRPPKGESDTFTIVDFYESKMNEYDSKFIFVPIRKLQQLRGMIDPTTGDARVNRLQIKLKDGADLDAVRDKLRSASWFDPRVYVVETWRDQQGPLLMAVQLEKRILNLLLFMIVAVAGFGILAIFYMIVVEKTRDIGILKSLGASRMGVMGIFLAYGLSLGLVGSGVGMVAGLLFVHYINQIAAGLAWITGQPVFDPKIYYFYKIPAIVEPMTVAWIVAGALGIAVAASVLPARRAARLHPVEALRYE
jgi:lipoprotein-releasing system permease protein